MLILPDHDVMVIGDTHGHIEAWENSLLPEAEDAEIISFWHVGDLGMNPPFLDQLNRRLEEIDGRLWLAGGNHDAKTLFEHYASPDAASPVLIRPRITYMPRGERALWGKLEVIFMGGAHSVDKDEQIARGEYDPRETITPEELNRAMGYGKCNLLICHDCPAGIDLATQSAHWDLDFLKGDIETGRHRWKLRDLVDETMPEFVVHGHYHLDYEDFLAAHFGNVRVVGLECDGHDGSWCILRQPVVGPLEIVRPTA